MNNNIENKINETFENYSPLIDNDEIWKNIEPHLKKKKKRRFILFWLLLAGLGLGLFYGKPSKKNKLLANHPTNTTPVSTNKTTQVNEDEYCPTNTLTPAAKTNHKILKNHPHKLPENPRPQLAFKQPTHNSTTNSKLSKHENIHPKRTYPPSPSTVKNKTIEKGLKDAPVTPDNTISNEQQKTKVPTSPRQVNTTKKYNLVDKNKPGKIRKKKKKHGKKRKNKKNWSQYIQLTAAPILPIKRLTMKPAFHLSELLKQRTTKEKQLEAFGGDFNFQLQHKKGFILTAGISYMRFNEKYYSKFTSVEFEEKEGLLSITKNEFGEIISFTTGNKVIKTTIVEDFKVFNSNTFFNFSLGFGKTWKRRRRKSSYQLMAGINYSLFHEFSGDLLNNEQKLVAVNRSIDTYDNYFKKSQNIGFWISAAYAYQHSKRLQWIVAPKFQLPTSSLTSSDYALNLKYFPISLNLGINYLLNPKNIK